MKKITLLFMLVLFTICSINAQNLLVPSNDDPEMAIALTVGVDFSEFAVIGTNVDNTDSDVPEPDCIQFNGGDVWYTVEVPTTGEDFNIETRGVADSDLENTVMIAYEGELGALVEIECNSDSGVGFFSRITLVDRTPGEIIHIRIADNQNNDFGEFQVSAHTFFAMPPSNDDPIDAIELTVGAVFTDFPEVADNSGATASEVADPTIPDPTCSNYQGGDVWYTVEVPDAPAFLLETKRIVDGINDSGMSVYEGEIGALVEIDCDDDDGEDGFSLLLLAGRAPGEILYVRLFEFGNNNFGEFEVAAHTDIPENDDPVGAIALTVGTVFADFPLIGNNSNTTASEEADPSILEPTCSSYDGGDIWYTVEVPSSGEVMLETNRIEGSDVTDTGMSIYEGEIGALVEIACDDDGSDDGFFSLITLTERTPGEILYIRVFEFNNNDFGEFQIAAYSDFLNIDENVIEGFRLFPNPVENQLNLYANSSIENVTIYNLLGQKILDEKIGNLNAQLNVSTIPKGTYVITVKISTSTGNYMFVKK